MNHKYLQFVVISLFFILNFSSKVAAQQDQIERLWYNEEKTAKIQVYKSTNGKFYGKIVWLKEPLRDGKVKIDIHNPDKKRHNDPIIGLMILNDFQKKGNNEYVEGTIYDPKNGKKYSCNILYKDNKLDVRGYYGFSFFGRTTVWTKTED